MSVFNNKGFVMTIKKNIIFCSALFAGAHMCAMDKYGDQLRKDELAWEKYLLEQGETKVEHEHRMLELKKAWYLDEEKLRLELGIKTRDEFISLQAKAIVRRQEDLYWGIERARDRGAQKKAEKK